MERLSAVHFEDYCLRASFCRNEFKGDGVAIWSRSIIEVTNIDCIEKSFEICGISYACNNESFAILNCYRAPCGEFKIFMERILLVLDLTMRPKLELYLLGDFSIDFSCRNDNGNHRILCNLYSFGLRLLVKWHTTIFTFNSTLLIKFLVIAIMKAIHVY